MKKLTNAKILLFIGILYVFTLTLFMQTRGRDGATNGKMWRNPPDQIY